MLSEHVAKLHISIIDLHELSPNRLCTYHLKKRVQVCGNNTLVKGCSNSIANALELLQCCTKPSTCTWNKKGHCLAECNVPAL